MPRKSPKAASPQTPEELPGGRGGGGRAVSITYGIGLGAATGRPAAG